jgi:hypothetical protein
MDRMMKAGIFQPPGQLSQHMLFVDTSWYFCQLISLAPLAWI